jgi:hypothetical protein
MLIQELGMPSESKDKYLFPILTAFIRHIENTARGDLDDALFVDIAATLRCHVRHHPGKSDLTILFLF